MKIQQIFRNLRILIWILRNRNDLPYSTSLRKCLKEARYELGYDDVGEWF